MHGLFGAIVAERAGTRWYRGQLTKAEFDDFWTPAGEGKPVHARQGDPLYEVVDAGGVPLVAMARPLDVAPVATGERRAQAGFRDSRVLELVHTDLNGIVYCDPGWATAKESNNGGCDRPKPAYSTAPADQPTAAAPAPAAAAAAPAAKAEAKPEVKAEVKKTEKAEKKDVKKVEHKAEHKAEKKVEKTEAKPEAAKQ